MTKSLTTNEQFDENARKIAVHALQFLASDPERLGRFLALTGLGPASIRDHAREPHFQAAILEYLLGDESLLLVFSAHAGLDPAEIAPAQRALTRAAAEPGS